MRIGLKCCPLMCVCVCFVLPCSNALSPLSCETHTRTLDREVSPCCARRTGAARRSQLSAARSDAGGCAAWQHGQGGPRAAGEKERAQRQALHDPRMHCKEEEEEEERSSGVRSIDGEAALARLSNASVFGFFCFGEASAERVSRASGRRVCSAWIARLDRG